MSKSKTPTPPSETARETPAALNLAGVAVALIGLSQAVAAVARFPNTPVPPALVERIGAAEDALRAAVEDLPAAVAVGVTAGSYDDDWIKERFESLDAALDEKLKTFAVAQVVTEALAERDRTIADLTQRLDAVEAAQAASAAPQA